MKMNTFYIHTMGCQMNEYDSDFLAQALVRMGYAPTRDPNEASVILINTCMVRAKAEQKAMSALGRYSRIKKRRPHIVLGVVGCLAQKKGHLLLDRFPQVDMVLGPRETGRIAEAVSAVMKNRERTLAISLETLPPAPSFTTDYFKGRVTGCISIMQGCNNFCAYCIVPYVRGREVSRPPGNILAEAGRLVSQGVREITLLGQNVNSYRWKGEGGVKDFTGLLEEMDRLDGLLRLRFTTSHPKDLSDRLIECFGRLKILCPHIHLPFQAGSDRILAAMKRDYTRDQYMRLVEKLRRVRPDVAVTSDVMVGFPGETREDFLLTLDLMERVQFDSLFSFKYSDRSGTLAEKLEGKVDESEKDRRLRRLQELQRSITLKKNEALKDRVTEVLVEGFSKKGGQLSGRTGTNKIVNFDGPPEWIGRVVNVRITAAFVNSLRGVASCEQAA
ncbi:MAG: tRNA (N6-isopentenyl adenosine(37)-C2)-methylthiotransferase MiaB [Deltaproteobacteria bacterium]|nr:tRNA (N6-isopentenyl adenosine(37)-C2)-methylthiotransferase MiaB [Deltaproteobacteria bacterium]